MAILVAVFLSLLAGFVVGAVAGKRSENGVWTGAGFAALGATAGLLIGMSISVVVAAAVATILGLLTLLVPVYFQSQGHRQALATAAAAAAAAAAAGQPAPDPAPPPPLPPLGLWLFPFAGMLLVGVVAGVAVRVNDALNFTPQVALDTRYRQMGFSGEQTKLILEGQARALAGAAPLASLKPPSDTSFLFNMPRPENWGTMWKEAVRTGSKAEENLARLKKAADPVTGAAITVLEAQRKSPEAILMELSNRYGTSE